MGKVISLEQKQSVLSTFNQNPSGCFIQISGYENKFGEVANYQVQSGVNYGNILNLSVEKIKEIKAGKVVKDLLVKTNVWVNPDGSYTNRKASGRKLVQAESLYTWDDPDFQKACDEILNGLTAPKEVKTDYEKEAKGLYSIDEETLYIRDCMVVNKVVVKEGEYPTTASLPFNALKDSIRRLLPVANYRSFKLENFESISINGNVIV